MLSQHERCCESTAARRSALREPRGCEKRGGQRLPALSSVSYLLVGECTKRDDEERREG